MLIPHWAIGLAIFAGLAAFIGFAFRLRLKQAPDWHRQTIDRYLGQQWFRRPGAVVQLLRAVPHERIRG